MPKELSNEELDPLLHSIFRVDIEDNGDGTSTQTIFFRREDPATLSFVIPASLIEMFGEMLKSMIPTEGLNKMTEESVIIPGSVEGV